MLKISHTKGSNCVYILHRTTPVYIYGAFVRIEVGAQTVQKGQVRGTGHAEGSQTRGFTDYALLRYGIERCRPVVPGRMVPTHPGS